MQQCKSEFPCKHSPTRLSKIVGWRLPHVLKRSRHPTAFQQFDRTWRVMDMGRQTFMHPLKTSTYKCQSSKDFKTGLRRRRRRLVGGYGFEEMGVARWHIRTLPHWMPSTFGWVCPYSHQNLMGERLHGKSPQVSMIIIESGGKNLQPQ